MIVSIYQCPDSLKGLRLEVQIQEAIPKRKGRRPFNKSTLLNSLLLKNKRLTMENEVLKSFL